MSFIITMTLARHHPPPPKKTPSKQTVKAKTNRQNKLDHTKQTKPHTPDTYSPILYYRTRQDLCNSTLYFIRYVTCSNETTSNTNIFMTMIV